MSSIKIVSSTTLSVSSTCIGLSKTCIGLMQLSDWSSFSSSKKLNSYNIIGVVSSLIFGRPHFSKLVEQLKLTISPPYFVMISTAYFLMFIDFFLMFSSLISNDGSSCCKLTATDLKCCLSAFYSTSNGDSPSWYMHILLRFSIGISGRDLLWELWIRELEILEFLEWRLIGILDFEKASL